MEINRQVLQEKWAPVLDSEDAGKIQDAHKRQVTAVILENQERAVREDRSFMSEAAPQNSVSDAGVDNWDPVLISLVRRAMPNLIAYSTAFRFVLGRVPGCPMVIGLIWVLGSAPKEAASPQNNLLCVANCA